MSDGFKFNNDTCMHECGSISYSPYEYEVRKRDGTLEAPKETEDIIERDKKDMAVFLPSSDEFMEWCIDNDDAIEALYKIDGSKILIEDFARNLYEVNKELKFI